MQEGLLVARTLRSENLTAIRLASTLAAIAIVTMVVLAQLGGQNVAGTPEQPPMDGDGVLLHAVVAYDDGGVDRLFAPEPVVPLPAGVDSVDVEPAQPAYPATARGELAALVGNVFPDNAYMATHVVWAESIGDWNAPPHDPDRWRCYVYGPCWSPTTDCGLMQTNIVHADRYAAHGWDITTDCFVPERNLVIAREVYDDSGGTAWTTY